MQLHTFTVLRQNALTFTLPPPYGPISTPISCLFKKSAVFYYPVITTVGDGVREKKGERIRKKKDERRAETVEDISCEL